MNDARRKGAIIAVAAIVIAAALVFSFVRYGPDDTGSDELAGEVYIVHTNDSHGYYDEYLGFSRVAAVAEDLESRGATVFLLDAGDAFQGTAITMLTHGSSTVDVMNSVGYDLMCPGNHEFDYTLDTYLSYTEELDFPTICANLDWADSGESVFDEYAVLERDGFRLGVFGLTTPDTENLVTPGYLDDVVFTDPVQAAEEMVRTLSGLDVDCIVALGHIGVDPSSSITSDEICAQVDGIDVFIDGHSHTVMSGGEVADGSITLQDSDTLIASTGMYIQNIGVVCLTADDGYTAELVSSYDGTDSAVDAVVAGIDQEFETILGETAGYTEIELTGANNASRVGETGMGDLVTDAVREFTGADFAVYNGGSIRASIEPGVITMGMLYSALPFENYIQTKTITGEQVYELFEHGVSSLPGAAGGFLQVSGLTVTYDSSRPAMDRVVSITLSDGTPIQADGEYTFASNDYVMAGGDNYPFLAEVPADGSYGLAIDAVLDLLERGPVESLDTGRLVDVAAE